MEEESEGHCDSDVSDSWSIVDFKAEEASSLLKTNSNSELPVESIINPSFGALDECYELTELTLKADPLNASLLVTTKELNDNFSKNAEESDVDADSVVVISEDEEYNNWKQAAHDNYQKTMRLLDESSPLAKLRIPLLDASIELEEKVKNTPESPLEHESNDVKMMPDTAEMSTRPMYDLPNENAWPHNCANFVTKHFFTSAIIAALACIALAQFFKTGTGKEKVAEMLEVLERLKGENEELRFQLQDLTKAYATLEAKVMSSEVPLGQLPSKDASHVLQQKKSDQGLPSGGIKDLLLQVKSSQNPEVADIASRVENHFNALPYENLGEDFQVLEQKIIACFKNIIKKSELENNVIKNLKILESKLKKRITKFLKVNRPHLDLNVEKPGINVIQWYPDKDGKVENEDDINTQTPPDILDPWAEQIRVNDRLKQGNPTKQCDSKKKSKNRYEKETKRTFKEKHPKVKYYGGNTCDQSRNKTGTWYLERGRFREKLRRADMQGEWQFARGRRDLKREEDKSMWYLRRFDMHTSRQ